MKLLGWMHRKFRQNSGDAPRDLPSAGPTCNRHSVSGGGLTEELHQLSLVLPARLGGRPIRGRQLSAGEPLLFEGLLSIGTLGSAPIEEELAESVSETELKELAAAAVEAIAEKAEAEAATETDLMVVNAELEKVLTEAAEKEGDSRLSSARPSHVSGGKANEACPLQEFLFGAAADTAEAAVKERKEKRASLGELFMVEEGMPAGGKGEGGEETLKKERGAAGVNVMVKNMLTRHGSYRSSRTSAPEADAATDADHTVMSAKFQKILQIFHRKIHPDNEAASKKHAAKHSKYKSKYTASCAGSNCLNGGGGDQQTTPSKRACRKGNKCGSDQNGLSLAGSGSTSGREHWIKTDADYLVLEL